MDGRSDLYSLGVMLYQMLAGVLPFRGESMAELMYKISNDAAPDVRIARPELPENLAVVIAKSMSKDPQMRYQDGAEFAADLRAVLQTGSVPVSPAAPAVQAPVAATARSAEFEATQKFEATRKMTAAEAGDFASTAVFKPPSAPDATAFDANVNASKD